MQEFRLESRESDLKLIVCNVANERFDVRLESGRLSISTSVYSYAPPGFHDFAGFFEHLASFPEPWIGELKWETIEEEFSISASCSALGQATFTIFLEDNECPEPWSAKTDLVLDFGQLASMATAARKLFGPANI